MYIMPLDVLFHIYTKTPVSYVLFINNFSIQLLFGLLKEFVDHAAFEDRARGVRFPDVLGFCAKYFFLQQISNVHVASTWHPPPDRFAAPFERPGPKASPHPPPSNQKPLCITKNMIIMYYRLYIFISVGFFSPAYLLSIRYRLIDIFLLLCRTKAGRSVSRKKTHHRNRHIM